MTDKLTEMSRETLHIYIRVSSAIQEEGTSLDNQRRSGEKVAAENGLDYEVHDEGSHSSASENPMDRPILRKLLARIENGTIRHLFVYNQDRLSRNEIAWTTLKVVLIKNEVILYTPNNIMSFDNPMDRLLFGVVSEISAYENALRSERTRQGKLQSLREGKTWKGGPPNFGYLLKDKQLIPNDDEVIWLKKMYEMYADGHPISRIRIRLIKNGIKTRRGGLWNDRSVDVVLGAENNCEMYAGSYTYKDKKSGEVINCKSPQVLAMKLIERVREEREKRSGMRIKREKDTNLYLLREILICDECGSKMWGRRDKKNGHDFYFCKSMHDNYRYKNVKPKKKCKLGLISGAPFERIIWDTTVGVLEQSNLFKDEIKTQMHLQSQSMTAQRQRVETMRKNIGRLKSRLAKENQLLSLLQEDAKEHEITIKQVESKILKMEADISIEEKSVAELDEKVKWIDWVGQFSERIDNLKDVTDAAEQRTFLEGILTKIGIRKLDKTHRSVNLVFKYPYVNDVFNWIDEKDKSKGYGIDSGDFDATFTTRMIKAIGKKTEIEIVDDYLTMAKK